MLSFSIYSVQTLISLGLVFLALKALRRRIWPSGVQTTPLWTVTRDSFLFGNRKILNKADNVSLLYEGWVSRYGPAFRFPGPFGSSRVIICDTKAAAHFYSKGTFVYVQTKLARLFIEKLLGRGLLWAEGESHKRQRKALSPAFSNAAIRKLMSVFYDSSYKVKASWDSALATAPDGVLIDVQNWMNHISLDSIGIAGFGHDFHSLDGHESPILEVFKAFGSNEAGFFANFTILLSPVFPSLQHLPTDRNRMLLRFRETCGKIADELLKRTGEDELSGVQPEEKSILGLLIKAERANNELQMSREEIMAQMNVLLLAGYETTSVTLTWALIELSRQPEKQQKLRDELSSFTGADPTWDQITSGLAYLDSVAHETLRLHPPVTESTRMATEDDIIPFSTPFTTMDGKTSTQLVIAKGTAVTNPISYMNQCEALWGPDAKEFLPERWLRKSLNAAEEIQGHRHLLTFLDGPRICLGKGFALAEFKAALSVLIRNYTFELPNGPSTVIERHASILTRPKVAGEKGPKVPLRVRRVE